MLNLAYLTSDIARAHTLTLYRGWELEPDTYSLLLQKHTFEYQPHNPRHAPSATLTYRTADPFASLSPLFGEERGGVFSETFGEEFD